MIVSFEGFGFRELKMVANLLSAYCRNPEIVDTDYIQVVFDENLEDVGINGELYLFD